MCCHRCIKDLANECDASDNGGCWSKEYTVNGKKKTYSACKDNIDQYKVSVIACLFSTGACGLGQPQMLLISDA